MSVPVLGALVMSTIVCNVSLRNTRFRIDSDLAKKHKHKHKHKHILITIIIVRSLANKQIDNN